MDLQAVEKFFADATRQDDRWPAALDPEFARPDDRSLFDLVDFACRFSSLIRYYSLDNRPDGDWVEFFTRDPVITMASIAATDVRGAERRLAKLEHLTRAAPSRAKPAMFREMLDAALELPRQTNRWLLGLTSPFSEHVNIPLRTALESRVRDSLREPLQRLVHGNPFKIDCREFADAWLLEGDGPPESIYAGPSLRDQIESALPQIRKLWRPFADSIGEWAALSRPDLSNAFEGQDAHQPHIALFVAFARLFSVAQASMNAVASRRTDFYFRRVLRERPRPAVPDTVHVAFACASDREPAALVVPAGTLLSAGKDAEGREIVFESQDDVRVTSASLRKVVTLRVASGRLASGIDQVVTQRVLARDVAFDRPGSEGWPPFGCVDDAPADIGFAISSSVLELAGGERTIALAFRYDLGAGSAAALTALSAATGLSPALLLAPVLQQAFALAVSTTAGWFRVENYIVQLPPEGGDATFGLRFALSRDAPAMTGLAGSGVAWPNPAVRASLRQERVAIAGPRGTVCVYPLSVLESLTITRVTAHVDVIGLRGVRISNVNGEVDQSRPFPAFGAIPTVGSTLRIRHAELFSKTVTRLACHIVWHDLPTHDTGFDGYFRGYVLDQDGNSRADLFDNQVFRMAVATERPGSWMAATEGGESGSYLFRTVGQVGPVPGKDGELAARTDIEDLVLRELPLPSPDYDPADGCIRVELTAPDYAFGHTLYQQNMMRAAMVVQPTDAACDKTCRDQHRVLLETRRQLDALSKDLRRKRPIAGAGHVASPRFWGRLPLRGLNAAYHALTRSLPAYAGRRHDAAPRPASAIDVHYADADVLEPAALPLLDDRTSRRIVAGRFDIALRALLNEAEACLSSCISERRDRMPLNEWRRLRQRLADAGALQLTERLTSLRDLQTHLKQAGASGEGDEAWELLVRCDTMLEAATWVNDCRAGGLDDAGWGHWRSISANLVKCVAALEKLHDSAIQRCKTVCLRPKVRPLPNPPFVPQVEALSIDYSASGSAAFAHVLPHEGFSRAGNEPASLLPRWAGRGILYLGFSQGGPTSTLRLCVQLGQGPRDQSPAPRPSWDALVENRWIALDMAAASDATLGLQRSGIVTLPVPPGDAGASTVLTPGVRWFRASVPDNADAFATMTAVLPHAATAVRQLSGTPGGDPGRALAARSIHSFVKPIKGIGAIMQPSPSFGGRSPESDRALQTRISERLRHKDRAILGWDYERSVLERFPEISLVRTLPARRARAGSQATAGPGHVRIVVMPGAQYPGVTDVTAPLASGDTLNAIARMLKSTAGPFVTVHVLNPVFVRLEVDAVLRWRDSDEGSAAAERLNAALVEYLSPWRSEANGSGSRTAADVEGFVRSRPDIESIDAIRISYDWESAADAEPERCVLTSALRHNIRSAARTAVAAAAGY
jgi:hypothetical protein